MSGQPLVENEHSIHLGKSPDIKTIKGKCQFLLLKHNYKRPDILNITQKMFNIKISCRKTREIQCQIHFEVICYV